MACGSGWRWRGKRDVLGRDIFAVWDFKGLAGRVKDFLGNGADWAVGWQPPYAFFGISHEVSLTLSPLHFAMSNYLRPHATGATIFFTVTLARRRGGLMCHKIEHLRAAVRQTRAELPFEILAWVVLPDHLHAIWRLPAGDSDDATRWKAIKTRFAKSVGLAAPRSASKLAKGERGIWQRRFRDHPIRDQADLEAHRRYCWINPVKHGLVERATDWPYSSIHRDSARGMVEPEWSGIMPEGQFGE